MSDQSTQAPGSGSSRSQPTSHSQRSQRNQAEHAQWNIGMTSRGSSATRSLTGKSGTIAPPTPVDQNAFECFAADGQRLYEWMSETDVDRLTERMKASVFRPTLAIGERSQSKFTNYGNIEKNGWSRNPTGGIYAVNRDSNHDYMPVENIFESFGISPGVTSVMNEQRLGPHNVVVVFEQDNEDYNGVYHERCPGARLLSTYNASDGLIVVQDALSPEPLILQGIQNQYSEESDFKQKVRLLGAIPELNRISDVIFLEWQLQCNRKGTDPRNLLISILHSVHTTETVQVIDHILDTRGCHKVATPDRGGTYEPPIWKHRITLMPGTQDFYAVLGTPDAAINAYLLLQHKIQLGHKRVKAIHISLDSWTPPGDKRPYDGATLTFEFEDVPQDFGSLESGEAAWMGQSVLQRGNVQGKSQSSKQPQQGGSKDVWPERLKEPPQLESASPQAESSKQPEQVEGSAVQANSSKKPKSPGGKKKFWNKGGLSGKTKGGT